MIYHILALLIHLQLQNAHTLVTYESTLKINDTNPFAGLKLVKDSIKKDTNFEDGITICLRFYLRKLGGVVFKHEYPGKPVFMEAQAIYKQSFFFFGSMNWIVKDLQRNSFIIWSTNRWHSICVSFDRKTSHLTLVKVKKTLNGLFL